MPLLPYRCRAPSMAVVELAERPRPLPGNAVRASASEAAQPSVEAFIASQSASVPPL
jgi:hypothetical protein